MNRKIKTKSYKMYKKNTMIKFIVLKIGVVIKQFKGRTKRIKNIVLLKHSRIKYLKTFFIRKLQNKLILFRIISACDKRIT